MTFRELKWKRTWSWSTTCCLLLRYAHTCTLTCQVTKHTHSLNSILVVECQHSSLLSIFLHNIFSFKFPLLTTAVRPVVWWRYSCWGEYTCLWIIKKKKKKIWQWLLIICMFCIRSHAPDTAVLTRGLSAASSPIRSSGRFAGRWTPSAGEEKPWSRFATTCQWFTCFTIVVMLSQVLFKVL